MGFFSDRLFFSAGSLLRSKRANWGTFCPRRDVRKGDERPARQRPGVRSPWTASGGMSPRWRLCTTSSHSAWFSSVTCKESWSSRTSPLCFFALWHFTQFFLKKACPGASSSVISLAFSAFTLSVARPNANAAVQKCLCIPNFIQQENLSRDRHYEWMDGSYYLQLIGIRFSGDVIPARINGIPKYQKFKY